MSNISYLYDFRFPGEPVGDEFQLVVPKGEVIDESMFRCLYKFLLNDLPLLNEQNWRATVSSCLGHHFDVCKRPRFEFVTFTREQFNKIKNTNGHAEIHEQIEYWLTEHERNSSIYEARVRIYKRADEADAERMKVPVGTMYSQWPVDRTDKEAYEDLKFYTGQIACETLIRDFYHKYGKPTAKIMLAELSSLEDFIKSIDPRDLPVAFQGQTNDHKHEYLRITNGYYDTHRCNATEWGGAAIVYGKYILFKEWLAKRLPEVMEPRKITALPQLILDKVQGNSLLSSELYEKLYRRGLLYTFFRVPAEPVHGCFWYDINGKETSDPGKVVRVSEISLRQTRTGTINDFPFIFNRQNFMNGVSGAPFNKFLSELSGCISTMIEIHEQLHDSHEKDGSYYELIGMGEHFIEWLNSRKYPADRQEISTSTMVNDLHDGIKLSISAAALVCIYKGIPVNKGNKDVLIQRFGNNSGDALYNKYNLLFPRSNRIGQAETKKQRTARLKLFNEVIDASKPNCELNNKAKADKVDFEATFNLSPV
jgi:hypothetical protein